MIISAVTIFLFFLPSLAESHCGDTGCPKAFPKISSIANRDLPNQPAKCHTSSDAWPRLWLDVVLLIDNSGVQTQENFEAMINDIKGIWQPDSGGPIVSQGPVKTRVGIVTFDRNARVVARLNQINSNQELINALSGLNRTTDQTVDGSNALVVADTLFGGNAPGDRPNVPNVIIIYTADWAGPDACQVAESIRENAVIVAITERNRNMVPPSIPSCVYTPGEIYDTSNPALDETLLESLSLVNCFCVGQNMPGKRSGSKEQMGSRASHAVWYQFWLPNKTDNKYYLRDKFAECVTQNSTATVNHDTAQTACHRDRSYLPNEFSADKHQFLLMVAQTGNILTQWIGLQYDQNNRQWYWDYYDKTMDEATRIPAQPGDYRNWNCNNQPDISNNQFCVRESPGVQGCNGFRWGTAQCNSFLAQYHNQYLCQEDACDALNYCSDF